MLISSPFISSILFPQHCDRFGPPIHTYLLTRLFNLVFSQPQEQTSFSTSPTDLLFDLLVRETQRSFANFSLASNFAEALSKPFNLSKSLITKEQFEDLIEKSQLEPSQLLILASSLSSLYGSSSIETSSEVKSSKPNPTTTAKGGEQQTNSDPSVSPVASDHLRELVEASYGIMINGGSGEGDLAGGDGTSSSLASSEALELAIRALEKDGLLEQASSVGANSNLPQGLITIMTSLLSDKSTNTASNEEKPLLDRSHRRKLMTYLSERLSLETISRAIIQILPSLRFFDGKLPADLLLDLGFSGTQTKETFMAIWNRFSINPGKSGEREISKCLARLISASVGSKMNRGGVITPPPGSNPSPETIKALEEPPLDQDQQGNKTIDFETFVKSVNALLASSDGGSAGSGGKGSGGSDLDSALTIWSRIIRGLDDVPPSELIIPQGCRLESLATVLYSAPEGVAGLWGEWARPAWQLAAISGLLSLPNEIFSFCSNVFYPNSSISTSTSNAPSNSPPTSSTPEGIYATRIVSPEDVNNASLTIRNLAESVLNSNWNRRELIETIAREAGEKKPDQQTSEVSSQGGVKEPKEIATEWLEKGIKENPECVAIGLVMVKQPWNQVHSSLASKLLSMFLAGHPSHQLVFLRLWQIDWRYLLNSLKNLYNENQGNVSRILDVAQDLKILEAVLDLRVRELLDSDGNNSNEEEFITLKGEKLLEWNKQSFSSLDVAALASRREYLNLDKWLQDNINEFQQYSKSNPNNNNNGSGNQYTNGNLLIQKTLEFLDFKTKDDLKNQQRFLNDPNNPTSNSNSLPLMVQTVAIFLRVLRSNGDFMNSEEIEFFKVVRNLCLQLHPRLMNLAPGKENTEPGLQVVTFSSEIHKEVSISILGEVES